VVRLSGRELGQLLDPRFELFDFVAKLFGVVGIARCELVFEPLKPSLLPVIVHLCLADVLALFRFKHLTLVDVGDLECIVNLPTVDAEEFLAIDARCFERFEYLFVVFE